MLSVAPVSTAASVPPLPGSIVPPSPRADEAGAVVTDGGQQAQHPSAAHGHPGSGLPTAGSAFANGQIQGYNRPGGRIVVAMGTSSASLVSAVADSGWSMHTWTGDEWLRVDFEQGTLDSIFYVTWNGHAPLIQTWGP
ncbi:hypothetical protein GXW82_27135 [Streptacidiphilus sp. 4-A2]|nr:hypothetical protein [Streptacidiphilus sp. 4-A2]